MHAWERSALPGGSIATSRGQIASPAAPAVCGDFFPKKRATRGPGPARPRLSVASLPGATSSRSPRDFRDKPHPPRSLPPPHRVALRRRPKQIWVSWAAGLQGCGLRNPNILAFLASSCQVCFQSRRLFSPRERHGQQLPHRMHLLQRIPPHAGTQDHLSGTTDQSGSWGWG